MSIYKSIINPNNITPFNSSSNKSNITDAENLISSSQNHYIIKLQKEYSLSEMNDSNNNTNNKSERQPIKTIKRESYNKNNLPNANINSLVYSYQKNNDSKHIIIESKPKRPNLMRNIHYKSELKKSSDSLRYQPMTGFENKLCRELSRLSNKYSYMKNRKFFNNQSSSSNLYWLNFPDYEIYRQLKELETRSEFPNAFCKPKLKPLICQKKNNLEVLAKNLYEADQVDRFKKFLNKQYKIKISQKKNNEF